MATSGSYDYTSTRDFIIQEAFRKIGALGDYETIDQTRLDVGINALGPMTKAFQAMGMPLWALTKVVIPMSNFTTTTPVTIGPSKTINQTDKPLKILQAWRRDGTVDTEMIVSAMSDYDLLVDKSLTGTPNTVFYQPLAYWGEIIVWYLPDSTWTSKSLVLRYQRPFQDFDATSDEPDFPVEWHEALIYNLAYRLAPNYGLPPNDRMQLKADAKEILDLAKSFDQETGSLFIRPEK